MFTRISLSAITLGLLLKFSYTDGSTNVFHVSLDESSLVNLNWAVNYVNNFVTLEVTMPNDYEWLAIGFSNRGEIFPADYCVFWRNWRGRSYFQDAWADERGVLSLDQQQDCLNFRSKRVGNMTKFIYRHEFDTCDSWDYIIQDGTTHIVWSRGRDHLYQVKGLNVSTSDEDSGMVRVHLLQNTAVNSILPPETKILDILADTVHVPGDETTYWCHIHKLPEEFLDKHHVVQFQSNIQEGNEGLIHHMEVFHCIAPSSQEIPSYAGSCFDERRPPETQVCKRVIAAWAMGAPPFIYPEEAGLPIGGPEFNPFIMLEVHYNNPAQKKDWIDSSGVRFYVTSKLRATDAGVIELGLEYTDKMAIPPKQQSFSLSGYCVTECTTVGLPIEGITIFGSQLHTHLTGIRVLTRHFRNGRELAELNRDNHYSTHFQEIRILKRRVTVLPGDALITTCDYNTEDRKNVTLGGFAISDEMCVNYIHYFPAAPLEVCKSSISDQALNTYFQYMQEWENQPTSMNEGISINYKNIEWNPLRVQMLNEIYHEAPLSMQCNMSTGDRFPGYWENTPVTSILLPLPPPARGCNDISSK